MWQTAAALCFLFAVVTSEDCSEFKDDCNDGDARMAQVFCRSSVSSCTCDGSLENSGLNTVECSVLAAFYATYDYDQMTASGCKDLCTDLQSTTGTACKYYKWEEVRDIRTCSLMSADQCTGSDTGFCGGGHCKSDGIDCNAGTVPTTPPPRCGLPTLDPSKVRCGLALEDKCYEKVAHTSS